MSEEAENGEPCPYCGESARLDTREEHHEDNVIFTVYRCYNPQCKMSTWCYELDFQGNPNKSEIYTTKPLA